MADNTNNSYTMADNTNNSDTVADNTKNADTMADNTNDSDTMAGNTNHPCFQQGIRSFSQDTINASVVAGTVWKINGWQCNSFNSSLVKVKVSLLTHITGRNVAPPVHKLGTT